MRARWWWILGAVVVIALVAWWWIRRKKTATSPSDAALITSTADTSPADFPLKQGSRGLEVLQLQAWLNLNYQAGLALDGILGPLTAGAWRTYGSKLIGSPANVVSREMWNYYFVGDLSEVNDYLRSQGITV